MPYAVPEKPRKTGQTWLKDTGAFERNFGEEGGYEKLKAFLNEVASKVDYVKLGATQHTGKQRDGFIKKMALYRDADIRPYLDHQYFRNARMVGNLEQSIEDAAKLGMAAMEFWNVGEPISPKRWADLVRLATKNSIQVIFEFHPQTWFDPFAPLEPTTAEEIWETVEPCFDAGASLLMIDHKEFDYLGDRAEEELKKLITRLGKEKMVFEVESEKYWEHLKRYFRLLGPDVSVANIIPDQVYSVDVLREETAG
jgi:phosphosulfolactate synthase (CoM biosynthesis protein A)